MVGKTIESIFNCLKEGYEDTPFLVIKFTDGSISVFEAEKGTYDGKSEGEYPLYIAKVNEGDIYIGNEWPVPGYTTPDDYDNPDCLPEAFRLFDTKGNFVVSILT